MSGEPATTLWISEMSHDQYLEECKRRARYFLDRGDAANAIKSMASHLMKIDEYAPIITAMMPRARLYDQDVEAARKWVEGFR